MKRNRNDVIAEIKTARDEARIKAHAYRYVKIKRYDYWRAVSAVLTYDEALAMFARATEHKIPDMAARAVTDFERAHDDDPTATEITLSLADGRRDALASVADWMRNEKSNS